LKLVAEREKSQEILKATRSKTAKAPRVFTQLSWAAMLQLFIFCTFLCMG